MIKKYSICTKIIILSILSFLFCALFMVFVNSYQNLKQENLTLEQSIIYKLVLTSFFSLSLLLVLMYFQILKNLKILKKLTKPLLELKDQELDLISYQQDKIKKLSFKLKQTTKKNQELLQSKQLFLHTIIHELKTPISKARISSELLKEDKEKERLSSIFLHMDALINEILKIETLFSKNDRLDLKPYPFSLILKRSKEQLMRTDFDEKVKIDLKYDVLINVDINLFSIMLKNLIDNALKYSDNNSCELFCYKTYFMIKNPGKALVEPIEHYLKPFMREKNTQIKGMGLGLYIAAQICKLHHFDLVYFYDKGHCFKICFQNKEK